MLTSPSLEQVCTPFLLTVIGIFNLDPMATLGIVVTNAVGFLGHDAFEIELADDLDNSVPDPLV